MNCIKKFTLNGNLVAKWSENGEGGEIFPHGIAIDRNDNIYITERSQFCVRKFDADGNFILKWGSITAHGEPGKFSWPLGIAVDNKGDVYIVDSENYRVQKFDSNGHFLFEVAAATTYERVRFSKPVGIAVDSENNFYLTDSKIRSSGYQVMKFDSNGKNIAGAYWDKEYGMPTGIAIDATDNLYVTDQSLNRIVKFDRNLKFIGEWGKGLSGGVIESIDPRFLSPHGISVDRLGYVYVIDTAIQKFHF